MKIKQTAAERRAMAELARAAAKVLALQRKREARTVRPGKEAKAVANGK